MLHLTTPSPTETDSCPYLSLGDELYMFKSNRLISTETGTSAQLSPRSQVGENVRLLPAGADLTVREASLYLVRFWASGHWQEGETLYLALNGLPVSPPVEKNGCGWPDLWDFQQETILLLTPSDCLSLEASTPEIAFANQLAITLLLLSLD